MHSSLEWAISAAASVALHFLDQGYSVEIFEADGPLHITGTSGQHSPASAELVVSRLTDLTAKVTSSLHYAVQSAADERAGQLVVAVLGRMDAADASTLLRLQRNRSSGLALLLDVDTFADVEATPRQRAEHQLAGQILRENAWKVIEVARGMSVAEAWSALEQIRAAA